MTEAAGRMKFDQGLHLARGSVLDTPALMEAFRMQSRIELLGEKRQCFLQPKPVALK